MNSHIIGDMKLVLDTSVLVAGLRSRSGASRRLLILLSEERFAAVASVAMMLEYEAVLKRANNLHDFGLTADEIDRFLDDMALWLIPVTPFYVWRPQLRDPADEHVLEAAVAGGVDGIVTFDLRHLAAGAARFGISVFRPGEALRRLDS
ncbi:MAG: putative toxin-antitoxin system toxin component, PIN family [Caldilineaceae bacterium]|nr:putative toxin-antitoxin system toxin component, PIN family [Caldilineaceae bacterium]